MCRRKRACEQKPGTCATNHCFRLVARNVQLHETREIVLERTPVPAGALGQRLRVESAPVPAGTPFGAYSALDDGSCEVYL
jgi:hypothetical protein